MGISSASIPTTGVLQPGAKIMALGTTSKILAGGRFLGRRFQALFAGVLLLTSAGAAPAQESWPQVAVPNGIKTADLGEQMTVNGLPIRMRSFTSNATPALVAEQFRQSLGQPLVDDKVGAKRILGRSQGEYFMTVQLEAAGTGTRGVIAVTELTAALNGSTASRNADQMFLAKLPAGFSIVSRTTSTDARNRVEHLVLTNTHSIALNTESVKSMLRTDGFTFERETAPAGQSSLYRGVEPHGTTLFFRSAGGEAVAVISQDDSGKTAVILNTTNHLEHAK